MTRTRRALAVPLAALLALAPAGLAHASTTTERSVPSEVRTYVVDGSLVDQLNDVYGVSATGTGIDFDETTTPGAIERVYAWSEAFRAGEATEHVVDILNEWIVPIVIADEPAGLATVWINPASVRPELASFVASPGLAAALSEVPDGSSLVRDEESRAWFALADDGILTTLVSGSTGLTTPVPVDDVAILPVVAGDSPAAEEPNAGVGFAVGVLVLLFVVIVVALVVPGLRKKKPAEEPDAGPPDEPDGDPAEDPAEEPVDERAEPVSAED